MECIFVGSEVLAFPEELLEFVSVVARDDGEFLSVELLLPSGVFPAKTASSHPLVKFSILL